MVDGKVLVPIGEEEGITCQEERSEGREAADELEAARQEAADYKDKYLRAVAEMENLKKRLERHAEERIEDEKRRLLGDLLTVVDDLEQALAHGAGEGVRLVYQKLRKLLEGEGVEEMPLAAGQPFDPYYHEAVAAVPGDDPDVVVKVVQKGYLYRGQLLRPAKVEVSRRAAEG